MIVPPCSLWRVPGRSSAQPPTRARPGRRGWGGGVEVVWPAGWLAVAEAFVDHSGDLVEPPLLAAAPVQDRRAGFRVAVGVVHRAGSPAVSLEPTKQFVGGAQFRAQPHKAGPVDGPAEEFVGR